MGWAEDQAKKIADSEEQLQRDREWQLHATKLVMAEGPKIFEVLAGHLETLTDDFNRAYESDSLRCERSPAGSITITKQSIPQASLSLSYAESHVGLFQRVVRTVHDPVDRNESLSYAVERDGQVSLDSTIDIERLAQRLLGRLTELFIRKP
jgi:hypothetical protein